MTNSKAVRMNYHWLLVLRGALRHAVAVLISAFLFGHGICAAAGFDCKRATTSVEKRICADAELSRLDESLNNAYLQALERGLFRAQTIKSQKQWLKTERNACKDGKCLKKAYRARIKQLEFLASYVTIFNWDREPRVNVAPFEPLSEAFKAILAMYAVQVGGGCRGSSYNLECALTSSLGLGLQCSKEQINLVRKWFRKEIPRMEWYPEWAYKEIQKPGQLESVCYKSPDGATVQRGWETIKVGIRKNLVFVDAVYYWTLTADGPSGRTGYSTVYRIAKDRVVTVSHKKVLDKKDEQE